MRQVFGAQPPMPAPEQQETFQAVLQQALGEECSLGVVQAVQEPVCSMLEERKADKKAETMTLSRKDVKDVLKGCGVSEEKTAAFDEQYAEAFGAYAELPAVNMVPAKTFRVVTPSVTIQVDPAHSDLIETRIIDGVKYVLIRADEEITVNGVLISIPKEN